MFSKIAAVVVLSASVASAVTLEWDVPAVGVPLGYTMYRQTVAGGVCGTAIVPNFEVKGSTAANVRTFVDDAPVVGANYYHVTAYDAQGESLPSNQVCFQMVPKVTSPQNLRFR